MNIIKESYLAVLSLSMGLPVSFLSAVWQQESTKGKHSGKYHPDGVSFGDFGLTKWAVGGGSPSEKSSFWSNSWTAYQWFKTGIEELKKSSIPPTVENLYFWFNAGITNVKNNTKRNNPAINKVVGYVLQFKNQSYLSLAVPFLLGGLGYGSWLLYKKFKR